MSEGLTVKFKVHMTRTRKGAVRLREGEGPPDAKAAAHGAARVPRVARLAALAVRFEGLVRSGEVKDYAELARLGNVTRARITQIMNITCLAPDLIEEILHLPPVPKGRDPLNEHDLRQVASTLNWAEQRRRWSELRERASAPANQRIRRA